MCYNISIITDLEVSYEFKDRNLEFLNQPTTTYIPFSVRVHLAKPRWKSISKKSCFFTKNKL